MTDTPTPHQKYAFDTEFFEVVGPGGTPGGAPARTAAPQPANPRQKAYDEGYTTGLKEGQQQAQADLQNLQQHLQNTLIALQKSVEERETQLTTQTVALLRLSLHHLVNHCVRHFPDEMLEQHLKALIPLIKVDETLTLRIHPQARGYHEKLSLPHASILGLPMRVVPDNALGLTDAVVEWKNGGVEGKLADHLKAVDTLIAGAGVPVLPAPPAPTEAEIVPPSPAPAAATAAPTAPSAMEAATQAAQTRAAELLGDDDLHDALKPKQ